MKKLLNHQVFKNMIALGLVQVANYILPLLAWPLLAKSLGVEQFGIVIMLLAICAMANILTDFGFNLSATHTIAKNAQDKNKIAQLLGNIFTIKTLLAVVACVVASVYIYFKFLILDSSNINIWTLVLVNLIIISQAYSCIWFFHGIEKMSYITKANILTKVAYVTLLFVVLKFYVHLNVALFCLLLSQLWSAYLFIWYIYKEQYFIISPQFNMLWQELKYSFNFFVSRVAVSVYTTANTLILGHFNGATVAGLYSSAEKLYGAGAGVSGIVSQASFPYLTKTGNLGLLVKVAVGLLLPVSVGCYVVGLFANDIMALVFGEAFRSAGELLQLFLILLNITFFSILIGYPGFSAIGKVQLANYTVMIGGVFHIFGLVMLYLLKAISAKNVILMIIVTETLILLLRCVGLFKYRHNAKGIKQ